MLATAEKEGKYDHRTSTLKVPWRHTSHMVRTLWPTQEVEASVLSVAGWKLVAQGRKR